MRPTVTRLVEVATTSRSYLTFEHKAKDTRPHRVWPKIVKFCQYLQEFERGSAVLSRGNRMATDIRESILNGSFDSQLYLRFVRSQLGAQALHITPQNAEVFKISRKNEHLATLRSIRARKLHQEL